MEHNYARALDIQLNAKLKSRQEARDPYQFEMDSVNKLAG